MQTETLILGGGLAGLALADHLHRAAQSFLLLEGRDRWGGRILRATEEGAAFDLGPAWFWPGQPRLAALVQRFGLTPFEQFTTGAVVVEDQGGRIQRVQGSAGMEGSLRLAGGLSTLAEALVQGLPPSALHLQHRVVALRDAGDHVTAITDRGVPIQARRVVFCVPPRIAAGIEMAPALPPTTIRAMQAVPTWMAGQAKAIAVYGRPFWREAGLSGDAMSRRGPLVELHDASPLRGGPFALFGFVGWPPAARQDAARLRADVVAQLVRMFGADAGTPQAVILKDWARDPFTATDLDQAPMMQHPTYGMPPELVGLWQGKLLFGGTEVAPQFGGFLEGALEAAEAVGHKVRASLGE